MIYSGFHSSLFKKKKNKRISKFDKELNNYPTPKKDICNKHITQITVAELNFDLVFTLLIY